MISGYTKTPPPTQHSLKEATGSAVVSAPTAPGPRSPWQPLDILVEISALRGDE